MALAGSQAVPNNPLDLEQLSLMVLIEVGKVVKSVPVSTEDQVIVEKVLDNVPAHPDKSFFQLVTLFDGKITAGVWAYYLLGLMLNWGEPAKDTAVVLTTLRELYPNIAMGDFDRLLDAAAEALASLGWVGYRGEEEAGIRTQIVSSCYQLARAADLSGDPDTAYNLSALALDIDPHFSQKREEIVRYALALGTAANRMHQVCICAVELASCVAAAADKEPARRLEAFDLCEIALERLAVAPAHIRAMAAQNLHEVIGGRDYLKPLIIPLYFFLPAEERPHGLNEALGGERWPERVSTMNRNQWIQQIQSIWGAQVWDIELDKARFALEPPPPEESAHADWTAWTVEHPAYRRAVPHSTSFLKETDFDKHLLVLTHEITHIFCMLGAVGFALIGLRAAILDAELTLWSLVPGVTAQAGHDRIANEGVAPLQEGNAGSLFRSEQALELTLKAQALQDVWTPWFEGLAIFGEVAADPALDLTGIGKVTECLRNLVDFYPSAGGDTIINETQLTAAWEEFTATFETRCSAAINQSGPGRLSTYLRMARAPYLPGYLAVRSVVAAWRKTVQHSITGTEAFNLLLHATRYGTFDAIPDLSIRSVCFSQEASQRMCRWVSQLAELSRDEIEDFLAPAAKDKLGRPYRWHDNRLVRITETDDKSLHDSEIELMEKRLREALSSLTRPDDIPRFEGATQLLLKLISAAGEAGRENIDISTERQIPLIEQFMILGSLLPIGRAAAKFLANVDSSAPAAYLTTQMRTTEAAVPRGEPSVNGYWFPIDHDAGRSIAESHRQYGLPRMHVTRVIDLGGLVTTDYRRSGLHILAYRYGDWFEIRGTTPYMEALLNNDPAYRKTIRELVRARLYPAALNRTEVEVIARGERGAQRTRDWIDGTQSWRLDNFEINAKPWASHVRSLAECVISQDDRIPRQMEAARALMVAAMGDKVLADTVIDTDFESITANAPEQRERLVEALFRTAQTAQNDAALAGTIQTFADVFPVFWRGPQGWDVRPAGTH